MPDVEIPGWVAAIIVTGVTLSALLGIVGFAIKTGRGVKTLSAWISDRAREAIVDTVQPHLERIENELTSSNGGSAREQINGIREDLSGHIAISSKDREELRRWLSHLDPDGPPET